MILQDKNRLWFLSFVNCSLIVSIDWDSEGLRKLSKNLNLKVICSSSPTTVYRYFIYSRRGTEILKTEPFWFLSVYTENTWTSMDYKNNWCVYEDFSHSLFFPSINPTKDVTWGFFRDTGVWVHFKPDFKLSPLTQFFIMVIKRHVKLFVDSNVVKTNNFVSQ